MNTYDALIALTFFICIGIGYKRGLFRSLFFLLQWGAGLYLSYYLYPIGVRVLRSLGLYDWLKIQFATYLNLENTTQQIVQNAQSALFSQIPQSNFILQHLQANNNPEVYKVLKVSDVSDYISGFFASMALNVISMIFIFILVKIILSILLNTMDFFTRLPLINLVNKIGGIAFGLIQGIIIIWIALSIMTFFFLKPENAVIFQQIEAGSISSFFYENNPIIGALSDVIP